MANKREAKLMRLLEHPALPRMVDYVERGEFCYLVMEYIRGKSLREYLSEGRVFLPEQILSFGITTAGVLEYLHNQDPPVCYGDLKPENLILSEHGKLYLVDLGSASPMYDRQRKEVRGTHGYAAPEQYGGQMKKSSDVYALGKTLQELAGKRLVLYVWKNPGFLFFLLRCCQRRADWRYSDMAAVKAELRKLRNRNRMARFWGMAIAFLAVFLALCSALFRLSKNPSFSLELDEITKSYYQKEFLTELSEAETDITGRMEIGLRAERQLQKLLKRYPEPAEQRHLLLMLARNAELAGEKSHAALYYEQLLLYQPEFREGYGEYGCFLFRSGRQKESIRLWEEYRKKESEGILNTGEGRDVQIWKEKMKIYQKYLEEDGKGKEAEDK